MAGEKRVCLISLGCAKNLVDSEHMLGLLAERGLLPVPDIESAQIAVVNTCGFVQPAVEEALETILEMTELKKKGRLEKVLVAGCLVQRYGRKLRAEMPEVDGWIGTGELPRIVDLAGGGSKEGPPAPLHISRPTYLADHQAPRIQSTPFFSAYLKIAEGCSHRCSFCIIPRLRGAFRSRPPESLLAEAGSLARRGVKELNLVAQDTTAYGADLHPPASLETLLEQLLAIPGPGWLRVLYCHPERVSDRLLELLEAHERLCPYLDLPIQHINDRLLKAMGRAGGERAVRELLARIRALGRRISLRTTLMVGFPGETESMFRELCDFVRQAEFEHLGVFVFSPEQGAAAARLRPRVDPREAEARRDALMKLQAGISLRLNRRLKGHVLPVLIEGPSEETDLLLKGRTATMAPEVDGQVLINEGLGTVGEILPVLIQEAHPYDLVGRLLEPGERQIL